MSRTLHVAIIASELPYPPNAGNRIRTLSLTSRLAKRHKITFIAHRNDEAAEAKEFLHGHGIESVLVDHEVPAKSGPSFYCRLAANLLSSSPYSVASHASPELKAAVRTFSRGDRVDLWQAETSTLFDLLDDLDGAPKLIMAHNVESLIWKRYHETESNRLKKWYIGRQWEKFERFEKRAFSRSSRVVAVSADDARMIREEFGGGSVDVVDNGIDRSYFERIQRNPDPKTILFVGGFDWRPNLDAVALLLDQIYPVVRLREPEARLLLVGRRPSEALAARVRECPGVELHADAPDVRPFLASSGIMVVPLRIGGGSRLKILEGLAAGLPVISTPIGAEGLELVPGRHFTLADAPLEIADALLRAIQQPAPFRAQAEEARRFVGARYDWDDLSERLERVWFATADGDAIARSTVSTKDERS